MERFILLRSRWQSVIRNREFIAIDAHGQHDIVNFERSDYDTPVHQRLYFDECRDPANAGALTNLDRRKQYMDGVDRDNPLKMEL